MFLKKLKLALYRIIDFKCYMAAADDKKCPPGNFYSFASGNIEMGRQATNAIKNVMGIIGFPYADSVCGKKEVAVINTRVTPLGDADYAGLPIGSLCFTQTIVSTAVTDAGIFIKNSDGFCEFLTTSRPVVVSTCTTALGTAGWHGMRIQSKVPTGVTCVGAQNGLYIETEVTGTGISGVHHGLKIETYVESGATLGDHYGAGIYTYDNRAGSNQLHVLRLEHNGANIGNAFFGVFCQAGKMAHLLESSTTDDTWMSITTTPTCSGAGGWEKVKYGGYTRYRQLWTTIG